MPGVDVREKDVIGKTVISADGAEIGTVRQLAFSLDGRVGFIVEDKQGEEQTIPLGGVQGVADFVVLRPRGEERTEETTSRTLPTTATVPAAATHPVARTQAAPVRHAATHQDGGPATGPVGSPPGACTHCGRALKQGAKFCGGCGTRVG